MENRGEAGAHLCNAFPIAVHQAYGWAGWWLAASVTAYSRVYSYFCAVLYKGIIYWTQLVSLSKSWRVLVWILQSHEEGRKLGKYFLQSFFQHAAVGRQLSFQFSCGLPPGNPTLPCRTGQGCDHTIIHQWVLCSQVCGYPASAGGTPCRRACVKGQRAEVPRRRTARWVLVGRRGGCDLLRAVFLAGYHKLCSAGQRAWARLTSKGVPIVI